MKYNRTHITYWVIATILAAVVAVSYGYMNRVVGEALASVTAARERVQTQEGIRVQNRSLAATYKDISPDLAKLSPKFVTKDGIVKVIEMIESFGPQTGSDVTLSNISTPVSDPKNSAFNTVEIGVTAHGSWSAVMKTLTLAESLPYASYVDKVRLDTSVLNAPGSKADASKRIWNLTFVVKTSLMAN